MGCQSSVAISNNITFTVTTHSPDTGHLVDADAVPAYRIYEDDTGTPILTGVMAKLDDPNTLGFYAKLIACTSANGFNVGKSYSIYITAAVAGDTGGISFGFCVTASAAGNGAIAWVYNVTDGINPLADVDVWVTTDIAGSNLIASGKTDVLGNVTMYLDDVSGGTGTTYYFWCQKPGYNFTNPDAEVVL